MTDDGHVIGQRYTFDRQNLFRSTRMPSLCCIKNHEIWFVYRKPVNFIFLDSRDEDPLCSLRNADVFLVVAPPPEFFLFFRGRESKTGNTSAVHRLSSLDQRIKGISQSRIFTPIHEKCNWSSGLEQTHPHYQPEIRKYRKLCWGLGSRARKSTIKRLVLEQNSLLFIYSKIVLIVQWVALVI